MIKYLITVFIFISISYHLTSKLIAAYDKPKFKVGQCVTSVEKTQFIKKIIKIDKKYYKFKLYKNNVFIWDGYYPISQMNRTHKKVDCNEL